MECLSCFDFWSYPKRTSGGQASWRVSLFLSFPILLLFATSCRDTPLPSPPQVTFYHWETQLAPDSTARYLLDSFASNQLYVKAFDLVWRDNQVQSDASLELVDTTGLPSLVPVVFITNEVFTQLAIAQVDEHAKDIIDRLEEMFAQGFPEVQIDCDWTARTQVQYFAFLRAMQAYRPALEVTCTVRLHQYRDRSTQGVPPVKRATLMAYNTGNLNDWSTENSIYDTAIVKAYLANQSPYPLKLDLAVAAYDWATVYRRDELAYLINEPNLEELSDPERFRQLTANRYSVVKSTYLEGIYLYTDDLIRLEAMTPASVAEQIEFLKYYVKSFTGQKAMVFRLGSRGWDTVW